MIEDHEPNAVDRLLAELAKKPKEPEPENREKPLDGVVAVLLDRLLEIGSDDFVVPFARYLVKAARSIAAKLHGALGAALYPPIDNRLQPLGINYLDLIPVGESRVADATVQRVFRPRQFIIPETVSPDFIIEEIMIDGELQNMAPVPAEVFSPHAVWQNVDFATVRERISVRVRNRGGVPRPFFSTMMGEIERPNRPQSPAGMEGVYMIGDAIP